MSDQQKPHLHSGAARSSPYPASRLAPAFELSDLAAEVARAESMLSARTGAKLRVIADQIRALQSEARKVLEEAQEEQALTRARCTFKRIPGHTYHLYRRDDGISFFSLVSPTDWGGQPPHTFVGSYRLEADYSWTPADGPSGDGETGELVRQLLRISGLPAADGKD